jgi:hypothetical protein
LSKTGIDQKIEKGINPKNSLMSGDGRQISPLGFEEAVVERESLLEI